MEHENVEKRGAPLPRALRGLVATNLAGRGEGVIGIETPCLSVHCTGGARGSHPFEPATARSARTLLPYGREILLEATVSEIHEYPLRPVGYAEPLFHCRQSRRQILEYLAESSWLSRASEAVSAEAGAAHARREPVEVVREGDTPVLVRAGGSRRIVRVLERWREVREWWSPSGGRDRVLYRVEVAGGSAEHMLVVDLAKDLLSGLWTLVGVVD